MKKRINNGIRRIGLSLAIASVAAISASAQTNGSVVLGAPQTPIGMTIPRGGAWIPGSAAGSGHFWTPDGVNGLCRVDGVGVTSNCDLTAKSPGQISVATVAGTTYVFAPDGSTGSDNVIRYTFNTATETLNVASAVTMLVPDVNPGHGGLRGARPVALAYDAGSDSLYVGYLKSGDIMRVMNASTAGAAPTVLYAATTSDGRGVNGLALHRGTLYLAEIGGNGLSYIPAVSGDATHASCGLTVGVNGTPACSVITLNPQISFFPGAVVSDGTYLYVGDSPITVPGSVIKFDPNTGNYSKYSVNVPSYTSQFDGVVRTQYVGLSGLGLAPSTAIPGQFDLYVGDDPTTNLALAVLPTNQGHVWKVAAQPPPGPTPPANSGTFLVSGLTVPRGGTWVTTSTGLGHYWLSDGNTKSQQGLCKYGPPLTACTGGTAKAGQIGAITVGASEFIFVPNGEQSAANNIVTRFTVDSSERVGGNTQLTIAPFSTTAASRPVSAVMDPTGADVLYVGYQTSGDIVRVANASTTSAPAKVLVAKTTDGQGIKAMAFLGPDLYLAEASGISKVTNATTCGVPAACTAIMVVPGRTPGAITTDGSGFVYFSDGGLNVAGSVFVYQPSTGTVASYSSAVTGSAPANYVNIRGLFMAPNGDLYVGDDPAAGDLAETSSGGGRLFKVPGPVVPMTLTSALNSTNAAAGPSGAAGDTINIRGAGFSINAGKMTITFNLVAGTNVICPSVNLCTVRVPVGVAAGPATLQITNGDTGQAITNIASVGPPITYAVPFSITAAAAAAPTVTSLSPSLGLPTGGTRVTITGSGFAAGANVAIFGAAAPIPCAFVSATTCTAVSPAGTGTVAVRVAVNGVSSLAGPGSNFTYTNPTAKIFAWGITAPKGGVTLVPGGLGGHIWSSDHAQGFCRQDLVGPGARTLPGTGAGTVNPAVTWPGSATLHALNLSICDDGSIGSSGQAVYDPRPNANPVINQTNGQCVYAAGTAPAGSGPGNCPVVALANQAQATHYIYVPDNAVKSTAVWRLTFDPATESIVAPPEAMVPLADVRTLKPNGMAIGPDCLNQFPAGAAGKGLCDLYISDLTEPNIRRLRNANGDPRTQTIEIIGQTGDLRGANGTMGFIGTKVFIAENRAASFMDSVICGPAGVINPATGVAYKSCSTLPDASEGPLVTPLAWNDRRAGFIPLPNGAFIGGVATDPVRNYVYASDSPGGANATIWRYDWSQFPAGQPQVYLAGGQLPFSGAPETTVWTSTTSVRPWNPAYPLVPVGGTPAIAGFSFAFGIYVEPTSGDLYITGDPTAGARSAWGSAWVAPVVQ